MTAPRRPPGPVRYLQPEVGRTYQALHVLRPQDRPVDYSQDVRTIRIPVHQTLPARLSSDPEAPTRWCRCCDTVLPPRGRSPFCEAHRAEHRSLERQRRSIERDQYAKIDKVALERIHELADRIGQDLGRLTIAYNTGQDLRREMDRVMLATKRLLGYVSENLPDTRLSS